MLILTRDDGEQVIIGKAGDVLTEPIIVTNCGVRGQRVRLGIQAQTDIEVHRKEVKDAIDNETSE